MKTSNTIKGLIIMLVLAVLAYIFLVPNTSQHQQSEFLKVTKVVDGDTFWVDNGTPKGLKIRLIGVDTPETRHPRKPVQYFGKEASDYMKRLLKRGLWAQY